MRVAVGRLGRPHGIRGEVTVEVRTDEPHKRFAVGSSLFRDKGEPLVVASHRWHGQTLLLGFEGVHDRNAAELLRNTVVSGEVNEQELPDEDDQFYDRQLIGMEVFTQEGVRVGTVQDVIHLPAQDLLSVVGQSEVLIPFVTEIVPTVDVAARKIIITPPPGLLTVNEDSANAD